MFWKKLSIIFLSIFCLFLVAITPASAQSNTDVFDTKLHTTVTVNDAGIGRIKHAFTITNKTPTTYVSQYGLKISSTKLKNITVISDSGQSIDFQQVTLPAEKGGPGQTSIGITFADKTVGEGKTRKFTISYTHPDAAVISGSVLEVTLPPQANPQDYSQYTVTLITPERFGGPIRTTPEKHTFTANGNQVISSFNQGGERGIFALFGSIQIFDLDLTYHLNNSTNNPGITQIALPPDTTFQKMHYELLEPQPEKIELDIDGNWIATYQLPASTNTIVSLKATALLTLKPNPEIPVSPPTPELLQAQEYWPVNNSQIKNIVQDLTSPSAINDYVVDTLSYNTPRALNNPQRLGALKALQSPDQAVCQEFSDLYVTLARAAGIYSRRITGYAHSQNSELRPLSLVEDILHAWPEYYHPEQQRWIPIDPTWENTTGGVDFFNQQDLNHIVFAINGHSSQTPYSAGSYPHPTDPQKTVNVSFGTEFPQVEPDLKIKLTPRRLMGWSIPGLYTLNVTNNTGQAHYNLPLEINHPQNLTANQINTDQIPTLLPFQTLEMPLWLENKVGWWPTHDTIEIKIYEQTQKIDITSSPQISSYLSRPQPIMAVASVAILITLAAGSLLVFRRKR